MELARWLHVVAAVGWLGTVLSVVFVLVPAMANGEHEFRVFMLRNVFRRVFRLASVLVALSFASGGVLFLNRFGEDLSLAVTTSSGRLILAGAGLGLAVGVFHFVAEPKLEQRIDRAAADDPREVNLMVRRMQIIPRIGLTVLVAASLLMVAGARVWGW